MPQAKPDLRRSPLDHLDLSLEPANAIALRDLSACARIGFKGVDTVSWLEQQNIEMADSPNQAVEHQEGLLSARLSPSEFMLIDTNNCVNDQISALRKNWSMDLKERTYLLERGDSHACISVAGNNADVLFSKICAVDLRPAKFANLSLAQTSVAKLNAIVIRADIDSRLRYLLLADISTAEYLSMVLLDAAAEFKI